MKSSNVFGGISFIASEELSVGCKSEKKKKCSNLNIGFKKNYL